MWCVVPVDDIQPHKDFDSTCACGPRVVIVPNGEMFIVHNLFDGREGIEFVNHLLKIYHDETQ